VLESERAKAEAHEATADELRQRIASLQDVKVRQQHEHGQAINKLLAELKEAQGRAAETGEAKRRAEAKYNAAREWWL
jgi:hypothetical protein